MRTGLKIGIGTLVVFGLVVTALSFINFGPQTTPPEPKQSRQADKNESVVVPLSVRAISPSLPPADGFNAAGDGGPPVLEMRSMSYGAGISLSMDAAPAGGAGDFGMADGDAWGAVDYDDAGGHNTESYDHRAGNAFVRVADRPLSTFSIDVDTASYANTRRFLNHGQFPPPGAVRIEEMVNYFTYGYAPPDAGAKAPFAVHIAVASCPWKTNHRLVRIALKGREIKPDKRPPTSLVFLLDVSGSMDSPDKLPLLKRAMRLLVDQLGENDRVAIAVYAGSEGLALESTPCDEKEKIRATLESLSPGGSTAGAQGIVLAYKIAVDNFIEGGVNRVILCTDGDFNIGITDNSQLVRLIREKARTGVFLSVLGFGRGNLKDSRMEKLADEGNGNYAYIDTLNEARKVLVRQMGGTLVTIAKDVKIQVEFNPAKVAGYRLIGYENRMLRKEDFNDDKKDAGEIGAGHTVTALYQVVPFGLPVDAPPVDKLKYKKPDAPAGAGDATSTEMLTVKLRYKKPDGDTSTKLDFPVKDQAIALADVKMPEGRRVDQLRAEQDVLWPVS